MEPRIPHDLAEHLKLVMSERLVEIVYHDAYDFLEQWFVIFLLVRKRGVTVVLHNFTLNVRMINVCGHGGDQLSEDCL